MTRRRRRSGPIRCETCHRPIDLLADPFSSHLTRAFEQRQVDGRSYTGGIAYPVENRRAWRLSELAEELMVRRRCSLDEALAEAYAMPWQPVHICPDRDQETTP